MTTLAQLLTRQARETVRAAIYMRQSRGKKKSIKEQDEECTEDAAELDWPVVRRYTDLVSASHHTSKTREEWRQLLADFRAGHFDVIIIWESSRAERKAADWLAFLEECRRIGVAIRVTSHGRTYDPQDDNDWKVLAEEGIANQLESAKLSRRIARATRKQAQGGRPHGKNVFGYRREYDSETREFVQMVPNRTAYTTSAGFSYTPAGVIEYLFAEVLAGAPLNQLVRWLNRNHIPIPSLFFAQNGGTGNVARWENSRWSSFGVKYMLTNTAYLGIRVHHRCDKRQDHNCMDTRSAVATDCWEAIVSQDHFDKVNLIINAPERFAHTTPGVRSQPKHLLSCLAHCSCGENMLYLAPNPKYSRPNSAYRCRRADASIPAVAAEQYIVIYVLDRLSRAETWSNLRERESRGNQSYRRALLELQAKKAELLAWQDAFAKPKDPKSRPSVEFFARYENQLLEEIEGLEAQAVSPSIPAVLLRFEGCDKDTAQAIWEELEIEQRRTVITNVVGITVHRAGKGQRNVPLSRRIILTDRLAGGGSNGLD